MTALPMLSIQKDVWSVNNGVFTATKDEAIWSEKAYDDFMLDLEFKNAARTNSGVIVHTTDTKDWIPHSVEIQIADDYANEWAKSLAMRCNIWSPARNKAYRKKTG